MPERSGKRAIVVGAGVGGVASAARLAHAGFDVEVYEKNDFSGGRCSLIHHDGYRFDQGPSLLLLPRIFYQLFRDLGENLDDHVELLQCHPNYVIHYHDGEKVTLSSDRAELAREVERWDGPGGSERLEGFLKEASIHGNLSYEHVLARTFPSILSFLRPSVMFNLLNLHPFHSLYGRCARYFKTERMRRAFSFGSMYLGSSPFDAPGTYTLLQWTETCEGIWYPRGGFHAAIQAVIDISRKLPNPVKYHFSTPVRSVRHSGGRVTGIELENGIVKEADIVIVNADLVWAHNHLFKEEGEDESESKPIRGKTMESEKLLNPRMAKRLMDKPHSCSSISLYWAMDRQILELHTHNIFLAQDYKESFDDIFKKHSMPKEPSFYVNVPSRIDPSAAPKGKDTIVVLVPVGHLLSPAKGGSEDGKKPNNLAQDWDSLVDRARTQVIEMMEGRLGVKGLRKMITWEGVNTPMTWQDKFNLTHGSILGLTHDFFNVLSFRPQARHPSIKGAYFVGASSHPGTGVPIAIAGSRLCTETILSDEDIPLSSTYTDPIPPPTFSKLDKPQRRAVLYQIEDLMSLLFPYILGAILAVGTVIGVMWYTDTLYLMRLTLQRLAEELALTEPRKIEVIELSNGPTELPAGLPVQDMDSMVPTPILWGSVVALFLSIAYINLPGGAPART